LSFSNREKISKPNSEEIQVILNIVNKEFRHLLHVENRTSIVLAAIGFFTMTVVTIYVGFGLKFNTLILIISFQAMVLSVLLMEYTITKDFGVKLPSRGIISHRSLRGVKDISEYIERFYSFQENKDKLIKDLSAFAVGLAIMAVFKKTTISILTYVFVLSLIINITWTYLLYTYKQGVKHLFLIYFISSFVIVELIEECRKFYNFLKKRDIANINNENK